MTVRVSSRLDVEFKTIDGLTLRAYFYPASKRGPAMVMSPGFNMPKDASLPDIAVWFQEQDMTCLIYDPRGIGESDGEPKNDVDARQQVEDVHDAVTWLGKHPLVDKTKIAVWGICFGGNVTLAAAALDKRVAAAIAIAPLIYSTGDPERRKPILELAMLDRENRIAGEEPLYLPYINEDGSVPNGLQMPAEMLPALERLGIAVVNRISVQTYHRSLSWNILNIVQYISPTPAMMVTPELDMACPAVEQLECYDKMGEPKELDILIGKGHIDWVFGDVDVILTRQLDFFKRHMKF